MKIFIETERLLLRELLMSDDAGMLEMDSDPEVHRYLGNSPIKSIVEARHGIRSIRQQYIDNGIGRWAVVEKETDKFVGWGGLKFMKESVNNHQNFYDVGYRFIRRFWGKGYATETAEATLRYGFEALGLKEIFGITDVNNRASGRILEKVGLQFIEEFDFDFQGKSIKCNWFKKSNPYS